VGDFIAAALALLSAAALTWNWPFATPMVWILNLWDTADLLNAYYKGAIQVADVGFFGAGIYVPALFVPILLIAHVLAFKLLLRPSEVKVSDGNSSTARDFPQFVTRPR